MKLICIGRNYTKHIEELANEKPIDPVVFLKPDTSILPKKHPFFIPDFSEDVHHEVEILVKINKVGKHIDRKFAHKYYILCTYFGLTRNQQDEPGPQLD